MASRKLVRDVVLSKHFNFLHLQSLHVQNARITLSTADRFVGARRFGVFNEFSKQVKGEAKCNPDFQQSVKELKDKAGELKGVKEELKVRTKETTEQLYKHVDGVWAEAVATTKKVSTNVKEKTSAATEEVKETLGFGKQESSSSSSNSDKSSTDAKDGNDTTKREESSQNSESSNTEETIYGKFKSSVSSASPKVSLAFQKLKDAKVLDLAKKGYNIVKDELSGNPSKKKRMQYASSSPSSGERSTRTDIVVLPTKQSRWGKKWESLKEKMRGHPVFKRVSGMSEPVVSKGQEFAEDMRERWETSDNPVVHKIQDLNESVFGETAAALSFKEIRRRDPSFSLPEFVAEVQDMIKPTLNAYLKGDVEALQKTCSPEVVERCKAEHRAYESQGIFFDNKVMLRDCLAYFRSNRLDITLILHISELEVRETKLMGSTPIIIVAFQTQQVYCVRDRHGSITEGGMDTIHTVYYAWAMQQMDVEELGEGAVYPVWRLREMQQLGVQALI